MFCRVVICCYTLLCLVKWYSFHVHVCGAYNTTDNVQNVDLNRIQELVLVSVSCWCQLHCLQSVCVFVCVWEENARNISHGASVEKENGWKSTARLLLISLVSACSYNNDVNARIAILLVVVVGILAMEFIWIFSSHF